MVNYGLNHFILFPILLPFFAAIIFFFLDERFRQLKSRISFFIAVLLFILDAYLFFDCFYLSEKAQSYNLGNWAAPFGIVLVLDKLSAFFLLLTGFIGLASLWFSRGYWDRTGHKFYAFTYFFLMGINGVILTGDLFNLFVFFEVMLAASYGLSLHSFDKDRVKFGFHYAVLNLVASFFLLIGIGLIYHATSTLNFADLALKISTIRQEDSFFLSAGFSCFGLAFFLKIGMWPVNFWMAPLYSRVPAPIGSFFSLISKTVFYILVRVVFLIWPMKSSLFAFFGADFLFFGGILTILYSSISILTSANIRKSVSYLAICSSGIILSSLSFFDGDLTRAMLYYVFSTTISLAAFFLLSELTERLKLKASDLLKVHMERGEEESDFEVKDKRLVLPNSLTFISVAYFVCVLLLVGMPPFAGFIGKFTMLHSLFALKAQKAHELLNYREWLFAFSIFLASLFSLIVLVRQGILIFWINLKENVAKVYLVEFFPILFLLFFAILFTVLAPKIFDVLGLLTQEISNPLNYIQVVLSP